MKLVIVAVGQKVPDWAQTAYDDYAKRFPPELRVELKAVKTEPRGSKTVETLWAAERQRIEAAIARGARVVALDERGTALTTQALAQQLKQWQLGGDDVALVIGGPDPAPKRPVPEGWRKFFDTGCAPALDRVEYVARAVTPPIRPVRFDARFFMIEALYTKGDLAGSGELKDLRWIPLEDAQGLELPNITRRVLRHVGERIANPPPRSAATPIPNFIYIGAGQHRQVDE